MIDLMIINYNFPDIVDYRLETFKSSVPHRWIVVDNGSDILSPSVHSTVFVAENKQWMSGFVAGIEQVNSKYIWLFSTGEKEMRCNGDPIKEVLKVFKNHPDCVGVFPALDGVTNKTHLIYVPKENDTQIPFGNICGVWDVAWLKEHIDLRLSSWGIDFDLGYQARLENKSLWLSSNVVFQCIEHAGYPERRKITLEENDRQETENMHKVLSSKYGDDWREKMRLKELLGV
jgi:hypothetical protein